jgi:hypothetical protein
MLSSNKGNGQHIKQEDSLVFELMPIIKDFKATNPVLL